MTSTTPVRRGEARRAELENGVVRLILSEGFAQLTLDDVAARLHCSKRTLYTLAGSKEQLVRAAVVRFFRFATERVERAVAADGLSPAARITAYLNAVAAELAVASPRFFDDLASFAPAAEVYERNTRAAARRIGELIDRGVSEGAFRDAHAGFVADLVAAQMVRIQQRAVAASTGLSDSEAYAELAALVTAGLSHPA
ncbi:MULTISPECIES: TetR/AcrR family transcriptional regulator [Streptomyces]|uniref:AcrR family transcriptional regulator n=2 Tax=Streptomyces TaxID=1883 RepID=A0ABT9L2U5_9ACTN|nr:MULTISPECIES: TetR/AcrR family transcriptional regulator [Streptomyces]MBW8089684.1 TetR/AcrR family transcriptional regulator [Streptomyces hygroscopicus subsp. hygroscopicus]MCO8306101.1 TetR/AcrR family transcriptional regulator [Streptomyces sp. RKCA744]MDN3059185.1 TetR/AcrR family transcriptional regulator [Streptomyces sp. SRF1]MDP9615024.1 AcrR family transcriptional regulator [Streptomyces demainii]GHJ32912.1 TetR family transcriptional regulator [Streptomyces hygroscopicus]